MKKLIIFCLILFVGLLVSHLVFSYFHYQETGLFLFNIDDLSNIAMMSLKGGIIAYFINKIPFGKK